MTDAMHATEFWQIVESCLEELYGLPHERAVKEIARLRPKGKASSIRNAQEMRYHAQPLHVAGNIMDDDEPMSEQLWDRYQSILARFESKATKELSAKEDCKGLDYEAHVEPGKVLATH